jgi:aspartate racemase
MKTVGIIGGIGPESTIDYYRSIIAAYQERKPDGSYPSIIINSVDLKKLVDWVTANELAEMTDYLVDEVQKLARAGADFGLLAANTPHIVFNDIRRRSAIPLLSIVQATCEAAKELGLKRLGLFGTRFTAQAGFYKDAFADEGMTLVLPAKEEQDYIHEKYMDELVKGIFLAETREGLLTIIERLKKDESIEALILGGTELPLILREAEMKSAGIPFLDTTQIHVKVVVAQLLP